MLTVTEAAVQLGVSSRRVLDYIADKRLKATRKSYGWAITENALKAFAAKERRPGNPHKKALAKVAKQERRPGRPRK